MAIPRILNNDSLTTPVPLDAPYYAYYFSPPLSSNMSMGQFAHNNQLIFKFIGYNAGEQDPYNDGISYSYSGDYATAFTSPPLVSTVNGWLNGTLKDIGANIISYTINVTATTSSGSITNPFQFTIVGGTGGSIINTSVEWNTEPNLGSISNGGLSDLSVSATFGQGTGKYRLVGGSLPPGLELLDDGNISGRVDFYLSTFSYTFTIEAYNPLYPSLIYSTRIFTLSVIEEYEIPYDIIYMGGLLSLRDRVSIDSLLDSIRTTQSSKIYRSSDPYFGVAKDVRYQHQYGVRSVSATSPGNPNYFYDEYVEAIQRNFYWKFLTLGPLKTAIATDENGNTIYEVVYSEIVDNLVNSEGVSISKKVGFQTPITTNIGPYWTSWTSIYTSNTYYDQEPLVKSLTSSSTSSVLLSLNNVDGLFVGMQITSPVAGVIVNDSNGIPPSIIGIINSTTIEIDVAQTLSNNQQLLFNNPITVSNGDIEEGVDLYPNSLPNMREQITESLGQFDNSTILPRWMNTEQSNGNVLGYVPCWVLCYTQPGKSAEVLGVKDPITGLYPTGSVNWYLTDKNLTLNQITFQIDRITVDRSMTSTYGSVTFDQWPTQPSTSVDNNSQDSYIQFPRKTILY